MILRFYGDTLRKANPRLSDRLLTRTLVRCLDIADDDGLANLDDYGYPEPNVAHPVGEKAQARKIHQAQTDAEDHPILALAHGYGSLDDCRRRLQVAWRAGKHGMWINRYGYLSDAKMKVVAEVCRKD